MAAHGPHPDSSCDTLQPVKENLSFQGFLRKRKDTMRFTWAKYWFKLQNTTLYFYTDKESQEASLRGQYYMYSVQSVRSLSSTDGDFTFEIVMKNGKRKLLSADSAEQRDVWIKLLWKSMQLPGPGRHHSSCTWYDIPKLMKSVSLSSDDGQPMVMTDDNSVKDKGMVVTDDNNMEVMEENAWTVQSVGDEDDGGPDSAGDVTPSPCSPPHPGEDSNHSSDSDIYDVPRPQAKSLHSGWSMEALTDGAGPAEGSSSV